MDDTYANIGYVSKTQKRAIVRGLDFPNIEGDDFKERPGLIISDVSECAGLFNGINIIAVPLTSLPYSDFDIPVLTELSSGKRKISYISTSNQFQFLFNEKLIWSITGCSVCPDRVFNLVLKVKKLLLKARKKDYEKAKILVKDYRLQFMKANNITMIRYSVDIDTDYVLNLDGSEEYLKVKGVTRVTVFESKDVTSIVPEISGTNRDDVDSTSDYINESEENDDVPEQIIIDAVSESIEESAPTKIIEKINLDDDFLAKAFIFTGYGANYVSVNDFIMMYKYYCDISSSEDAEVEVSSEKDIEAALRRMYPSVGKRKSRMYTLFNTVFKIPLHGYSGMKWNFEFLREIDYEQVKVRDEYSQYLGNYDSIENVYTGPVSPKNIDIHESSSVRYNSTTGQIYENDDEPESVYEDANGTIGNAFAEAFKKMSITTEPKEEPKVETKIEKSKVEETVTPATKEKVEKKSKYVKVSKATDDELLNFIKLINNSGTCVEVAIKLDCTSSTVVHRFNQTMKELERRGLSKHIIEWPFKKG